MKKLSFILSILCCYAITACNSDEPTLNPVNDTESVVSNPSNIRTVEEAIEIVSNNYADVYKEHSSRTINLNPQNVVVFGSNKASRAAAVDTAIYVVNFGDNNGFAIVAADKECTV